MTKPTFKEKFHYWFDGKLAKGTLSMIRMPTTSILILILFIALIVYFFSFHENNSFFNAFWDSFASTINASVLYSSEGKIGYILLMAISAIIGILFTSILIGILSNAIEEKLKSIKYGNSKIIEENHTIILGFNPNTYQLINQLCMASERNKECIVVAGNTEKDVMHQLIRENVDVPKNIRIKCRNIDILNPNDLNYCSLPTSKSIIINELDDNTTIKILLAVNTILKDYPDLNTNIVASIKNERKIIPANVASNNKATVINIKSFVARLIAYSSMQLYFSNVFTELLDFSDSEFYIKTYPSLINKSFLHATLSLVNDTPIGIIENNKIILNPKSNSIINEDSKLIVFSKNSRPSPILKDVYYPKFEVPAIHKKEDNDKNIAIVGYNDSFETIINELKMFNKTIYVADTKNMNDINVYKNKKLIDYTIEGDINNISTLEYIVDNCTKIIILSDDTLTYDEADNKSINILLLLRNIRIQKNIKFSIIVEMNHKSNKSLVLDDDETDFIVSSDIISMIQTQISKEPCFISLFRELLSEKGNEVYLKLANDFVNVDKEISIARVRAAALKHNCIFLGYIRENSSKFVSNPNLKSRVKFNKNDKLIIISED
ncbi:MAG: hypothetical protein QM266_05860 [Bacillota bacterium]|nr:hypothetical protein [Bacillota bacterium]